MLPDFRSILFGAFLFYKNMKVAEKNLEDYIFNTSLQELEDCGLCMNESFDKIVRQMNLGVNGRLDIATFGRRYSLGYGVFEEKEPFTVYVEILELKSGTIDPSTIAQAVRYAHGMNKYLERERRTKIRLKFTIMLIGKSVTEDAILICSLASNSEISFMPYTYNYENGKFNFDLKRHTKRDLI